MLNKVETCNSLQFPSLQIHSLTRWVATSLQTKTKQILQNKWKNLATYLWQRCICVRCKTDKWISANQNNVTQNTALEMIAGIGMVTTTCQFSTSMALSLLWERQPHACALYVVQGWRNDNSSTELNLCSKLLLLMILF